MYVTIGECVGSLAIAWGLLPTMRAVTLPVGYVGKGKH